MPNIQEPMQCIPGSPLDFVRETWHFFALATWGGIANYTARVKSGSIHHFSVFELAGDIVISGFVGTLAYVACREFGMTEWITAATVGIAGHLGSRTVFIIERFVRAKFRQNLEGVLGQPIAESDSTRQAIEAAAVELNAALERLKAANGAGR